MNNNPESKIYHFKCPTIYDNKKDDTKVMSINDRRSERILRHKSQALLWNQKRWGLLFVKALDDRVELIDPSGVKSIPYHVSDEFWEKETGWEN